jgi:ribose/xylose/arabinose/galactoside ABC-type transport system permease subunit
MSTDLRTILRAIPRGPVIFALMFAFLLVSPALGTGHVGQGSFSDVMTTFAATAPIAVAVGLGMIAGQFDLSCVATYGLGGMLAVKFGGSSPALGLVIATGAGILAASVQGAAVAFLRVNSVPVTLGGYLALWGITNLLGHNKDVVVYSNTSVNMWLIKPVLGIFTVQSVIIIGVVVALGLVLRFTRFGISLRAVGGDATAAEVAGIRTRRVLISAFAIGGAVAGFGGGIQAYALVSASSAVTFAPLITAITAVIVGGVAMSGGRGTMLAIATGVLSLALLTEALVVINVNPQVVTVVTGTFLLLVALAGAPELNRVRDMLRVRIGLMKGAAAS